MFNTRLLSIIRKEFIQITRDPRTLILVLVIPVMQLFLLGYAANNDVRNVPLAVFDQDRSPEARALLSRRGVPFREVSVSDAQGVELLKKATGDDKVPALTVGTVVQRGYEAQALNDALDTAGYPRTAVPGLKLPAPQTPQPAPAQPAAGQPRGASVPETPAVPARAAQP